MVVGPFRTRSGTATVRASNYRTTFLVWGSAAALCAFMAVAIGPRLAAVWRCYRLADSAERELGTVVGKHESVGLVFNFGTLENPGEACTAKTPAAVYEGAQIGDEFEVVRKPGRSDQCYLTSALTASGLILAGVSTLVLAVALLIVSLAVVVQRSFAQPAQLTTRFENQAVEGASCPSCSAPMKPGYIVPFAGIHWRDAGAPIGLPTALGGLPGAVGWRGRPRLQAIHCEACGVVTFKYAKPARLYVPTDRQ